jgi:hypothetical protein
MSWRLRGPRNAQGNPCRIECLSKILRAKGYRAGVKVWMVVLIFALARIIGGALPYKWRRAPFGLLLLVWPLLW